MFLCFCLTFFCSILQTWRWVCEGSGSRFGLSLNNLVWLTKKQWDMIWCHLGQWLFLHHLPNRTVAPGAILLLLPPRPKSHPSMVSVHVSTLLFFSSSKWWLCYLHLLFLCSNETVQRNKIDPEENCKFAYGVYESANSPVTDRFSCLCIRSQSSAPKNKIPVA